MAPEPAASRREMDLLVSLFLRPLTDRLALSLRVDIMLFRGTFRLGEAFREAQVARYLFIVCIIILASFPLATSAASFSVDSKYGKNCTQQLQCGSAGLVCLEGICQYVSAL